MAAQPRQAQQVFEFGAFSLDSAERRLLRDGQPVPLTPKAFDVLLLLVGRSGHVVSKEELLNRVWADSFVEEGNLKVIVSVLRKALGERSYIETVSKRGYRFAVGVRALSGEQTEMVVLEQISSSVTIEESDQQTEHQAVAAIAKKRLSWPLMIAGAVMFAIVIAASFWLKKPSVPAATSKSIVVLPFKPLTADSRDESLELGLADTLITRLSGIKQLSVRPLSAVRKYSSLDQDALAAGHEQRVEAVLDGSLQRVGERIRVTVRLISTADGQPVWVEQFDERFTDILALEDSIARQVTSALAVQLTGGERQSLTKHYTENPEAHNFYLQGRYFWNKRSAEAINKSIDYFNQAIEKDPGYALAYVGLADAYLVLPLLSESPPQVARAKAAARRALEIDEQLAEAHATLGGIASDNEWDWAEADRQFRRAIELDANYATAHQWYGEYLDRLGRSDDAIRELQQAEQLDPLSLVIHASLGQVLYHARRYDQAIEQMRKTLEMDPNFLNARLHIGLIYLQKQMYREALGEFQKALELSNGATNIVALVGAAQALSGNRAEAEKALSHLKALVKDGRAQARDLAIIYIGLGDQERAFAALAQALEDRSWLISLLKVDPYFDPLRTDARFAGLLARVGLQ
ncbi:MAG TPA: winged helix-turn-helix domain-containing protein [Blastocatellia bacterium]|nr:winged helix-turn-helix domain-containing protein [Blastocatellia bacterium]